MVNVYYDVICRDCTAYVSTSHLSTLKIKKFNSETDFTLSKKLKELREKKFPCSKCGSLKSEIINIKCKGVKFFDKPIRNYYKDEVRIFIAINIEKTPFTQPVFKTDTSQLSFDSVIKLIDKIIDFLNRTDSCSFKTNPYGHFDIICSEKELYIHNVVDFRIDKLVICGFSRDVILILLTNFKEDILKKNVFE